MRWPALLALFIACAAPLSGQTADTTDWMQGAEIREIRTMVAALDSSIRNARLARRDSSGYCEISGDTTYVQFLAERGGPIRRTIVWWKIRSYGRRIEYSYDTEGKLRYAAEDRVGVDGSEAKFEVFWRPDRSKILFRSWIVRTRVYPWGELDPLFNPRFATALFCSGD